MDIKNLIYQLFLKYNKMGYSSIDSTRKAYADVRLMIIRNNLEKFLE